MGMEHKAGLIRVMDDKCNSADLAIALKGNTKIIATTIQLFGYINTKGQREAFHVYSMKQAIEEGFILDVLQNYTTYDTFYQINKEIEEDTH